VEAWIVKAKFLTKSILKKNSTKIILKKNMEKHCSKTKIMWGNIIAIHNVFFKKTTKQNSQPTQYEKNKIDKNHFRKKKKKIHKKKEKKSCGETL
jgi:hypothetical protein